MKSPITIRLRFLIASFFLFSLSAQASEFANFWQWKNPMHSANPLYSTCCNSQLVAIGGANGYISISDDAISWQEQHVPINDDITALCFAGDKYSDLLIFTQSGKIVQTNGNILSDLDAGINAATRSSSAIWLACTDGLYSSTNKSSFEKVQMPTSGLNYTSVMFLGSNGWATTSHGKIFSTSNNGTNWTEQSSGTTKALHSICFATATVGWAVGIDGIILHTSTGGQTWQAQQSTTLFPFYSCYFTDELTGWAVGANGQIAQTTNGGAEWTLSSIDNVFGELRSISVYGDKLIIPSNNSELVVGSKSTKEFANTTHSIIGFNLRHISSQNNSILAVGENGSIIRSEDAGKTWASVSSGYNKTINACAFVGKDTAYFSTEEGTIYRSLDNGSTWKKQSTSNDKEITSMSFDANYGIMVGRNGVIQSTDNSGKKFILQISGTQALLLGVYLNKSNAWICGENGIILKSSSYGISWTPRTSNVTTTLNDIMVKGNIGFAVGASGVLLKTTDAGDSWTKVALPTTNNLTRVYLDDNGLTAIVVGENSTMFVTSDGSNWSKRDLHFKGSVFALNVAKTGNDMSAWIAGTNGMLMNYTTATASVENNDEFQFTSAKISPNPVLGVLRIQKTEELENLSLVEIFNYSGELVHTYQAPQNNSLDYFEFNTNTLSAGAYLVKLQANNISYYLKMIKQ